MGGWRFRRVSATKAVVRAGRGNPRWECICALHWRCHAVHSQFFIFVLLFPIGVCLPLFRRHVYACLVMCGSSRAIGIYLRRQNETRT